MKYIKKNKLTVLIIIIFVMLVIVSAYLYKMFFGGSDKVYGNRLDGIEEVEITKDQYKKIKDSLKENENVVKVSTDLKGKIVNIIITVKDEVSKDDAKNIASTSLNSFDEAQLKFYDIQVFVKKDNSELNDFPIVGYKQNLESNFSWTLDRQVTKDEN